MARKAPPERSRGRNAMRALLTTMGFIGPAMAALLRAARCEKVFG